MPYRVYARGEPRHVCTSADQKWNDMKRGKREWARKFLLEVSAIQQRGKNEPTKKTNFSYTLSSFSPLHTGKVTMVQDGETVILALTLNLQLRSNSFGLISKIWNHDSVLTWVSGASFNRLILRGNRKSANLHVIKYAALADDYYQLSRQDILLISSHLRQIGQFGHVLKSNLRFCSRIWAL